MKRIVSLLLAIALFVPVLSVAEENDDDLSMEDITEDVMIDDEGNELLIDDETGEAIILSDGVQEELDDYDADIDDTVDPASLEINPNLPDNVINILLIGVDTRDKEMSAGDSDGRTGERGDVMIILSVNTDTGDLKLSSILRDTCVTIPGKKNKYKINTAYGWGGGQLAMRTVNHNFEMNIQYYVAINFYGLVSIIDSLGGIDIELTKVEAGAINAYLNKNKKKILKTYADGKAWTPLEKRAGVQHLSGIQAVMYARLREIDNDFARTERQRNLLNLLLQNVLDGMDFDKLLDLVEACLPYARTNMNASSMFKMATAVLRSGITDRLASGEPLMEQFRLPVSEPKKLWKYGKENGSSVILIDYNGHLKDNTAALHEFIYGSYYPAN